MNRKSWCGSGAAIVFVTWTIVGLAGCKKCDPSSCDGCCLNDKCFAGSEPSSCGSRGGACQQCSADEKCDMKLRACLKPCVPQCEGKKCGDPDGCDGACQAGSCQPGWECQNGKCICKPNCENRGCGDDGCGGSCKDSRSCSDERARKSADCLANCRANCAREVIRYKGEVDKATSSFFPGVLKVRQDEYRKAEKWGVNCEVDCASSCRQ